MTVHDPQPSRAPRGGPAASLALLALVLAGCGGDGAAPVAAPSLAAARVTVPGKPTNVVATPGNGSATVRWSAPKDGGSPIIAYRVIVEPYGNVHVVEPADTVTVVPWLTNGQAWKFQVFATNKVGSGPRSAFSKPVIPSADAPAPDAPTAPTNVVATAGDAQAVVRWTAPASPGGSPIASYRVTAAPGGPVVTVAAPATQATVPGLTNGTPYTFTVAATNATATSPSSAPSAAVTPTGPATVPGAPTGVSATAGDGQATVRWTAPASTGGSAILSHRVTVMPGGRTVTVAAPATTTTITALTNGTAYTFAVAATNAVGTGASSAPSAPVTPTPAPPPPPPPPAGRWVSGYWVGYQRGLYPEHTVDFSNLTHIFVGRIRPLADGSVVTNFDYDEVEGPAMARTLSTRAHQAGRKALLMLGGEGEHGGFVGAASSANRARFVANLLRVVDDLGYDGIDVDWEPIELADRAPLLALLDALRAARPGLLLTVPVGWVNMNFAAEQADPWYAQLAQRVDQLNIMSYSMAGPWGWEVWHHSALTDHAGLRPSSVSGSVQAYLAAGVPRAKLGVGIGAYGSCWHGTVLPRQQPGSVMMSFGDNSMSYANIMAQYHDAAYRVWDAAAQVPYLAFPTLRGPAGCGFVSYEDEQSVAAKGAYVRAQGLGGTIVWTIGQGHLPNAPAGSRDPLLRAAYQSIVP